VVSCHAASATPVAELVGADCFSVNQRLSEAYNRNRPADSAFASLCSLAIPPRARPVGLGLCRAWRNNARWIDKGRVNVT
jgi:hypothetical protein